MDDHGEPSGIAMTELMAEVERLEIEKQPGATSTLRSLIIRCLNAEAERDSARSTIASALRFASGNPDSEIDWTTVEETLISWMQGCDERANAISAHMESENARLRAENDRLKAGRSDWYADVLAWSRVFCPEQIGTVPKVPSDDVCLLRSRLVLEEYEEFEWAMDLDKIPEMADAIADLIYVLLGTAIAYGIDMRPVWAEVQRSNLSKAGGERRADGKVQKPAGFTPPDIAGILERQGPIGGQA